MNFQTVRKTLGVILCLEAAFMLPPLLLCLVDGDPAAAQGFGSAIAAMLVVGLPCMLIRTRGDSMRAREGCVTVALAWIVISLFGAVPFYVSGVIPDALDAVFETISGFSTTGTTLIADVESVPRGILLWRSISHWIGGMGVLIFVLAIAPVAKEGGSMFLLKAEFPGPMAGKLVPRMQKSAGLLYKIYILMTAAQIILLIIGSVPVFDAVNISLSTVSTGGFAVKNDSLISYSRYAQDVTMVFMFLCGMGFNIFYCVAAGEFFRIKGSSEFKFYLAAVVAAAVVVGASSWQSVTEAGLGVDGVLFQVISIVTTTAYSCVPAETWSALAWSAMFMLMIMGPMAGSTGGGMKASRVMILLKSTYRAITKTITPGYVHLVQLDDEIVDEDTVSSVNSFAAIYLLAIVLTALVLSVDGLGFGSGIEIAISGLGNVGVGINAAEMSALPKIMLCLDMFLGRLEFFPMLILFAPETWRK